MKRTSSKSRLKLLATVGVASGRVRSNLEDQEEQKRRRQKEQLQGALARDEIDITELQAAVSVGSIESAADRFFCWKLLLGVIPVHQTAWDFHIKHRDEWYTDIAETCRSLRRSHEVRALSLQYVLHLKEDEIGRWREYIDSAAQTVADLKTYNLVYAPADGIALHPRVAVSGADGGSAEVWIPPSPAADWKAWPGIGLATRCRKGGPSEKEKNLAEFAMGSRSEDRFDWNCAAYVLAYALEVDSVGGYGTFWCLQRMVEQHLEEGKLYLLLHFLRRFLALSGELRYCPTNAHAFPGTELAYHATIMLPDPELNAHFDIYEVSIQAGVKGWLRSLFLSCLKVEALVIVWDRLLAAGLEDSVCVAAALLSSLRSTLLPLQVSKALHILEASGQAGKARGGCAGLTEGVGLTGGIELNKIEAGPFRSTAVTVEATVRGVTPRCLAGTLVPSLFQGKAPRDKALESVEVLQQLGHRTCVVREVLRASGLLSKRDFILLHHHASLPNAKELVVVASLVHVLGGDRGCTRGDILLRAWLISPLFLPDSLRRAPDTRQTATYKSARRRREGSHGFVGGRIEGAVVQGVLCLDLKGMVTPGQSVRVASELLQGLVAGWQNRYDHHSEAQAGARTR